MNDAKVTNAVAITHINNAIQWLKFFKICRIYIFLTGIGHLIMVWKS